MRLLVIVPTRVEIDTEVRKKLGLLPSDDNEIESKEKPKETTKKSSK